MMSRPAVSWRATAARMALAIRRRYSSPWMGQSSAMRSLTNWGRGREPMTEVGKRTFDGMSGCECLSGNLNHDHDLDLLGADQDQEQEQDQDSTVDVMTDPILSGVVEVLLGVDFDVAAGRVDVGEGFAVFDHFLEEEDQVGLFERGGFAPGTA